jgi:hypothetical protein
MALSPSAAANRRFGFHIKPEITPPPIPTNPGTAPAVEGHYTVTWPNSFDCTLDAIAAKHPRVFSKAEGIDPGINESVRDWQGQDPMQCIVQRARV